MQQGLPFDAPTPASVDPVAPPAANAVAPASDSISTPSQLRTSEPFVEFYFVRHRRARRYLVRVDVDGRVRVTIPRGGSRREANAFAQANLDWIHGQRGRLTQSTLTPQEQRVLRVRAAAELPPRLLAIASDCGVSVSRVSVRNQRSRWGSCSRDGHITLNWRLVLMPDWVRDYVLIHEVMHMRRHDHSPEYWKLVGAAFPRHREARDWLKRHGPGLQ